MRLNKKALKKLIREAFAELPPEESEMSAQEERADQILVDDAEKDFDALMSGIEDIDDPKMKHAIIKMFQDLLISQDPFEQAE
jgi:hypothetical protein